MTSTEHGRIRRMRKQALAILALLPLVSLAALEAPAQGKSGIRGRIVDKFEHAPIGSFVLVHSKGKTDAHVYTDRSGRYALELAPGIYDLFISAEGFSPVCRKIEIEPGKMANFDVALEVSTLGMNED